MFVARHHCSPAADVVGEREGEKRREGGAGDFGFCKEKVGGCC